MDMENRIKLEEIQEYLNERKNSIFQSLKLQEQKLETLSNEISEKQTYIEVENRKEKQESNIFTLYPTTQKYEKEKQKLNKELEQLQIEKNKIEETISSLKLEFETVEKHVVTNQVMIQQAEKEESKADDKSYAVNSELIDKLKFCLEIIELDKERCALELQNIISDLEISVEKNQ